MTDLCDIDLAVFDPIESYGIEGEILERELTGAIVPWSQFHSACLPPLEPCHHCIAMSITG